MAAGDREIGTAYHFVCHIGSDFRRMLQVGVHHAEKTTACSLPSADYRRRETSFTLAADDPNLRMLLGISKRLFPSTIRAIVIDHDNFVLQVWNDVEHRGKLLEHR